MCMPKPPDRPSRTPRTPGWTSSSYYGYDPEREADYARAPDLVAMGRAGVNSNAIANVGMMWNQGMSTRERIRGYNYGMFGGAGQIGGPTKNDAGDIVAFRPAGGAAATTPTEQPAATAALDPLPINPLEGLNINIPDPPPPPRAYQAQTSSTSKNQRRARTRKSDAKGKSGLTIKRINY